MNNIELRIVTEYTAREEKKAKMIKLREASYKNVERKYNSFKSEDLKRRIDSQKEINTYTETAKEFNVSYIQSQNLDYINFLGIENDSIEKIAHRAIKIRDIRTDNIKKIYISDVSAKDEAVNEENDIETSAYQVYKNSDTNINFDKYSNFVNEDNEDTSEQNTGFVVSPEVVEIPKPIDETEVSVGIEAENEERIMPQVTPERVENDITVEPIASMEKNEKIASINESNSLENEVSIDSASDLKEMLARAQSLRDGVLAAKQERENAENSANAAKEKLSDTTKKFESYCESLEEQRKKEEEEAERLKTEAKQYQATINDMLEAMGTVQA